MPRQRSVLYVIEGDAWAETGFSAATRIARAMSARLVLQSVLHSRRRLPWLRKQIKARALATGRARSALDRLAARASRSGVDARKQVLHGVTVRQAVANLEPGEHELVVKDAARAGGGSWSKNVARREDWVLARDCPLPLLLVSSDHPERIERVLAAVKLEESGSRDLEQATLGVASRLASGSHAELHVAHAVPIAGLEYTERLSFATPTTALSRLRGALEDWRREALVQWIRSASAEADPSIHVEVGQASDVVYSVARRVRPQVIVVGVNRRSGLGGLFSRTPLRDLVGRVQCSLLCIPATAASTGDLAHLGRAMQGQGYLLEGQKNRDRSQWRLAESASSRALHAALATGLGGGP